MGEAVADDEIIHVHHDVVAGDLVEYFLRQRNVRRLVFHDDAGTQTCVVEHTVAAAAHAVEGDGHLVSHQCGGIALFCYQIMDEVLAHPFLRCQRHVFSSQYIKHHDPPPLLGDAERGGGEVERTHRVGHGGKVRGKG